MAENEEIQDIKISELSEAQSTDGLYTVGVNGNDVAVKIPLGQILSGISQTAGAAQSAATNAQNAASSKLPANLGLANAGKTLKVGADGNVIAENVTIPDISGKLDKAQGVGNAGKVLAVGNDGNVTPASIAIPDVSGKLDKSQGTNNAGKVMVVGQDGNLTPQNLTIPDAGNTINLGSEEKYTLAEAVEKVVDEKRKPGACITFIDSDTDKWVAYQFTNSDIGKWTDPDEWAVYGGGGSLDGIQLNGTDVSPNEETGKVNIEAVESVTVNGSSQGVTQNGGNVNIAINIPDTSSLEQAVTTAQAAAEEAQDNSVTTMNIRADGDDRYLQLIRQGASTLEVQLPAMGGGGSSTIVNTSLSLGIYNQTTVGNTSSFKLGDRVFVGYSFSLLNADGENYGGTATLTLIVQQGSNVLHQQTIPNVSSGTSVSGNSANAIEITDYMQAGTISVYLRSSATYTDNEGNTATASSQAFKRLEVLDLSLTTSYNIVNALVDGGYANGQTIVVPFAVSGSGSKEVTLYLDGEQADTTTITRSGTTNGQFTIDASSLAAGRHSVQMVASVGSVTSNSIFFDILKAGSNAPFIGLFLINDSGTIFDMGYPTINAVQYEPVRFSWVAYDPNAQIAVVSENEGGNVVSTYNATRGMALTYSNRWGASGTVSRTLTLGTTTYPLTFVVAASTIDIGVASGSLAIELTTAGRSNSEANPAQWEYTNSESNPPVTYSTRFYDMDWNVSGWNGDSLVLKNGARAVVGYKPFASDPGATGKTIEIEFRATDATDRTTNVISCISTNGNNAQKGFTITTERISLLTGGTKTITDEEGNSIQKPAGVFSNYATGEWIKVAFVLAQRTGNRLMELYINGVRCAADVYQDGDSFLQDNPVGITFNGTAANLEVRTVRIYDRSLDDDEELDNFIIDRTDTDDMVSLYNENAILNEGGTEVSLEEIRSRGKGVMKVIRQGTLGGLADLNATNNKSAKFYGDVMYWSPLGEEYDWFAKGVLIQIQGTSSTKYPRKNYRITLNKGDGTTSPQVFTGANAMKAYNGDTSAVALDLATTKNKVKLRPTSIPINIFVAKKDFSDSSMTHNTGSSKLMNDAMKQMGILTPSQEIDPNTRTGFDGIPIDIFSAETSTGETEYYGQYNLNNEKKSSGTVYGFEGVTGMSITDIAGDTANKALCCLEFLNNAQPLCNFQLGKYSGTTFTQGSYSHTTADETAVLALLTEVYGSGYESYLVNGATLSDYADIYAQLNATYTDSNNAVNSFFDQAFEFRYPENDTLWNPDTSDGQVEPTAKMKVALLRLFVWFKKCKDSSTAVPNNEKGVDSDLIGGLWKSTRFANEISSYFNQNNLLSWYIYTDYFMSVDQRAKNMMLVTWDGLIWWFIFWDADTMLGDRNDSYLAYDYLLNRTTYDSERSKYGFEGHDSWLWNFVLCNMQNQLRTVAGNYRTVMTNDRVNTMFDIEQQGNWSARAYNKSGYFSYIVPQLVGVAKNDEDGGIKKYDYMYALKGTGEAHRHFTIRKRFSLLDAKYQTSTYTSDNIDGYLTAAVSQLSDKTISVVADDIYYFGWGSNNTPYYEGGIFASQDDVDDSTAKTLTFGYGFGGGMNDPVRIYGASRMSGIDLSHLASVLTGTWDFGQCIALRSLVVSTQSAVNASWNMNISNCTLLEVLNITNQQGATTAAGSLVLNLSNQARLQTLLAGGTKVTSVVFAKGAPLSRAVLPNTVQTLRLLSLPNIALAESSSDTSGLWLEGYSNVETLIVGNCPNLDWEALAELCTNLTRLRVELGEVRGDGSELVRIAQQGYNGVDENGNNVSYCAISGIYRLTSFIDDAIFEETGKTVSEVFPELTVVQPEYSVIEFDDAAINADDESTGENPVNISNLDNKTGYKYGTPFVKSGHALLISRNRKAVIGTLDTADGVWKGSQLNQANFAQKADGSNVSFSEGKDSMIYEPHCWYKGVNDYANQKKYIFWSANQSRPASTASVIRRDTLTNLLFRTGYAIVTDNIVNGTTPITDNDNNTGNDAMTATSDYNVYRMNVEGMVQVRFPAVNHSRIEAVFANDEGIIIAQQRLYITNIYNDFDATLGDYTFCNVPSGASWLYFTAHKNAPASCECIAVNSSELEAIEPDWVEHEPDLVAIYHATLDTEVRMRSRSGQAKQRGTGTSTTSTEWTYDSNGEPTNTPLSSMNFTQKDFQNLARRRGFGTYQDGKHYGYQLIDYEQSKFAAILWMSLNGTRDVQSVVGRGSTSYSSLTNGHLDSVGMGDTSYGSSNTTAGNKILGYEDFVAVLWECMDNVAVNVPTYRSAFQAAMVSQSSYPINGIWHIFDPVTQTERTVQGRTESGNCIVRMRHGRFCDVIASKTAADSTWAKWYTDAHYYTADRCRCVGRSNSNAYAHGGLVYAYAVYAFSFSGSSSGARLAFRGKILIS